MIMKSSIFFILFYEVFGMSSFMLNIKLHLCQAFENLLDCLMKSAIDRAILFHNAHEDEDES